MAWKTTERKGRVFTVELNSKSALKNASLGNGTRDGILIEGTLGRLKSANFLDGVVLEVVGTCGVLRVDLASKEIRGRTRRAASRAGGDAR